MRKSDRVLLFLALMLALRAAAHRHPGVLLQAADCVMPSGMPHEILPELIEEGFRHPLQWAIRPDLTPAELLLIGATDPANTVRMQEVYGLLGFKDLRP